MYQGTVQDVNFDNTADERGGNRPEKRESDRETALFRERAPFVLVLDNLRSAFNVGNIFRLAEASRAQQIITCGYTATPPHSKVAKTARGCDSLVPCCNRTSASEACTELRGEGYTIYVVETSPSSEMIWNVQFDFPAALVLGNEALGVETAAMAQAKQVVELPCFGHKNSINVGNCAAVVTYTALEQWYSQCNTTSQQKMETGDYVLQDTSCVNRDNA